MKFYDWLKEQKGKDTLAGAMIDDLEDYKDVHVVQNLDRIGWLQYFVDSNSSKTGIKALELVWEEFETEPKKKCTVADAEDKYIKKLEKEILGCELPVRYEKESDEEYKKRKDKYKKLFNDTKKVGNPTKFIGVWCNRIFNSSISKIKKVITHEKTFR